MPEDVKPQDSSSGSDVPGKDQGKDPKPDGKAARGADKDHVKDSDAGEKDEKGDYKPVPYSRFKEVNSRAVLAEKGLSWYQENIGNPDDVLAFRQWKKEQQAAAENKANASPDEDEPTAKELKAVRTLLLKAFPELAEMGAGKKQAEEALYDEAVDSVRSLAKDHDMPEDEKFLAKLGRMIMVEISEDPKLLRMWNAGNVKAVEKAFDQVNEDFFKAKKKAAADQADLAANKRRMQRLPTTPSGKQTLSQKSDELKGQGLSKKVHQTAWEIMQEHMQG